MTNYNSNTPVPIVKQLSTIFRVITDEDFLASLKAPTGRPGYTVEVLWRTYIAMVVLGLPTFASLIRALQNNPLLAVACGITSDEGIPTKYAYSRFMRKLVTRKNVYAVKNIFREMTRILYKSLLILVKVQPLTVPTSKRGLMERRIQSIGDRSIF